VLFFPRTRHRTWVTSAATGLVVALLVGTVASVVGITASPAEAAGSSSVIVRPTTPDAPFPDLKVTVSQTRDLVSQGITVTWTGGKQSTPESSGTGGNDYLQIMQCGGDEPIDPDNPDKTPQPDRLTCEYGAANDTGASRHGELESLDDADPNDLKYTGSRDGTVGQVGLSIPFLSAAGDLVSGYLWDREGSTPQSNLDNPFFTANDSNEVKWAGSGADGSGSTKFEIQTATQSPGLGCGLPLTANDGTVTGRPCWLVIVPRSAEGGVTDSGLFYPNWKHRLAVRLNFQPTGVRCTLGADEQQLAGSELAAGAVSSWQPQLCAADEGSIYTMLTGNEEDAASNANGTDVAPLALTSFPLRAGDGGTTDSLRYAPIALSGLAVSFAIDREPRVVDTTPADVAGRAHLPFTEMKLTPRLVAKLLTTSYLDSLPRDADRSKIANNPKNITLDPEFLAINDAEWKHQGLISPSLADLLVPQGQSGAATALWSYVMADADGRAFMQGAADKWGMVVNPWSSSSANLNPGHIGLEYPRPDFPKADPVEQPSDGVAGPINAVTWRPFTNDLDTGAYLTLRGDGQVLGGWNPQPKTGIPRYDKMPRDSPGSQKVLGLTDTASAAKFQVVTASLRNPSGEFVAPTTASMTAAAAAMTRSPQQSQVYQFDAGSSAAIGAKAAYPLTMPVYAAVNPAMDDEDVRASYAEFIRYAATNGQTPGRGFGQLPEGYAPLPQGWRDQALKAASAIQAGVPVEDDQSVTDDSSIEEPIAPVDEAVEGATDPNATGDLAGALAGVKTPKDPATEAIGAAVPLSLFAGVLSALAVPAISRFRRRL